MLKPLDRVAIVSDIHANLDAFTAVLADIREQGVGRIINLGDVVGYGPEPVACMDLAAAACAVNLCGNHDYAVLYEAEGFNPIARTAVDYHRSLLKPRIGENDPDRERRWRWLESLEPMRDLPEYDAELMHASPRQPITEYVLPTDPEADPDKLEDIFHAMGRSAAFVGHTHYPGVIEREAGMFLPPHAFNGVYELKPGSRIIVNVGSVGQPRDQDPRSCYVIFDGIVVEYRRVTYDVEAVVKKVLQTKGLHELCGYRLRDGR